MALKIINKGETGRGFLVENDGYYSSSLKQNNIIIKEMRENKMSFLDNPVLYCVLQKYGIVNSNGRIYPQDILMGAVDKYMESIEKRSAIGSVDHEDSTTISLRTDTVGLLIEDVFWEGATLIGKLRLPISRGYKEMGVISNGADNIANLIVEHNIAVGISSRGVGEVDVKGGKTYVTDYDLICWDFVQMPSTIGSWVYTDKNMVKQHVQKEPEYANSETMKKENKQNTNSSKFHKLANYLNTNM